VQLPPELPLIVFESHSGLTKGGYTMNDQIRALWAAGMDVFKASESNVEEALDTAITDLYHVLEETEHLVEDTKRDVLIERDTARFQIERAIAQLQAELDRLLPGESLNPSIAHSVKNQLLAFVDKEGGPWFQRG